MTIKYNLLNLPSEMQYYFGHTASYLYDANGVKRKVKYTVTDESIIVPIGTTVEIPKSHIVSQTSTDYCGNVIYENGVLNMILTNEGFITMNGTIPTYHYYLKDHQGNNRVVFNQSGTIEQTNHYYPSGIAFGEGINTSGQRYKYNGKELDKMNGLNWHDYGARHYDAAIVRWGTIDPLAEKYYSISPYAYCMNNPIRFIDTDGKKVVLADGVSEQFKNDYVSTVKYLKDKGVGQYIEALESSSAIYTIAESKDLYSSFDANTNTITWNSRAALLTPECVELSAATLLNHEADHGAEHDKHPNE